MMHSLCDHEGFTSLGYKHRGPICPIIIYVLIPNIIRVVHKLVEWWGEDESPNAQGVHIKDLNKKSCMTKESLQN